MCTSWTELILGQIDTDHRLDNAESRSQRKCTLILQVVILKVDVTHHDFVVEEPACYQGCCVRAKEHTLEIQLLVDAFLFDLIDEFA